MTFTLTPTSLLLVVILTLLVWAIVLLRNLPGRIIEASAEACKYTDLKAEYLRSIINAGFDGTGKRDKALLDVTLATNQLVGQAMNKLTGAGVDRGQSTRQRFDAREIQEWAQQQGFDGDELLADLRAELAAEPEES